MCCEPREVGREKWEKWGVHVTYSQGHDSVRFSTNERLGCHQIASLFRAAADWVLEKHPFAVHSVTLTTFGYEPVLDMEVLR